MNKVSCLSSFGPDLGLAARALGLGLPYLLQDVTNYLQKEDSNYWRQKIIDEFTNVLSD